MVNAKHAFWLAFVFTIIIFAIGLIFGFFIESKRSDTAQENIMKSEINLLDEQIRNREIVNMEISCDLAKKSTFDFADKIYLEAQNLEKYAATNKFLGNLKDIHSRYDLLRMLVWDEASKIRSNCSADFHIVIYFFNYDTKDLDVRAEQSTFSRVLTDLKNKYPDKILLIPIASNLDLGSVNLALDQYNITKAPAILIDNRYVIDHLESLQEIENTVLKSVAVKK